MPERAAVVDASVIVDVLARTEFASAAVKRLAGTVLHVPAHFDAEVLSALGRLHRAGALVERDVDLALRRLTDLPATRHPLSGLLAGSWRRRENIRLVDALYVELASVLDLPLLTTDRRLARSYPSAEVISP